MLRQLNTFNSDDDEMNRLQNNLDVVLTPVLKNPILDSNIVKSVNLLIGDNLVNHKLGRSPSGWIMTRKRGPANFYDKQDFNQNSTKNYIINSDAVVTVDIYFF